MNYWLMKSEPDVFSLDDLRLRPEQTESWDGVRNYQARNFIRMMMLGDKVFFYHSNTRQPGIVGIAVVVRQAYPDYTQFDPKSRYFDPKSTLDNPRWDMVDIRFEYAFSHPVTLATLKCQPEAKDMLLTRKGNRLSVMPVSSKHWQLICHLAGYEYE